MDFDKRLKEFFIELPDARKTTSGVVSTVQIGKLLYISGQLPYSEGKLSFKGRLGMEIALDQGILAAKYALTHCLSCIHESMGTLNKVKQVIQLSGFIASAAEFKEHDRVLDAASTMLQDIFGAVGKHTRLAVGVHSLPQNACLELSLLVEVK